METKHSIYDMGQPDSWYCYVAWVLLAALIIRVIICTFKAHATATGEHLLPKDSQETEKVEMEKLQKASFYERFRYHFDGCDDLWLPFFIGIGELGIYPFLMRSDRLDIIAGWLAFKTFSGWKTWENRRTAFNRFLFSNLLSLAVAYALSFLINQ